MLRLPWRNREVFRTTVQSPPAKGPSGLRFPPPPPQKKKTRPTTRRASSLGKFARRTVQSRRAKALAGFRFAPPLHKKGDTRRSAGCRFCSSHSDEKYNKLSSAILQSRQGRMIVARYVSEARLRAEEQVPGKHRKIAFLAPQTRAQRSAFQVRIRVRAQPMLLSTGERSELGPRRAFLPLSS